MAINGGTINAFLELDTSGFSSSIEAARQQASVLGDDSATTSAKVKGVGTALQTLGAQSTLKATAPLLSLGTDMVKSAIDYESAFAGVRKTVNATDDEYQALSDSLMDMSGYLPASAADLAQIMEIAGQLGVDKDNLTDFTEVIANLGVATNLSGEEAATMLAQYANITGMDLYDIDRLGSVIVALGNNCATTEKDITEMAQRLAGTGALLNLSDAQIMGLSATMSSLGINAEAGGSAMSRTLQTMNSAVLQGGDDLAAFAEVAGTSSEAFAQAWQQDPLTALDAFLGGVKKVNDEGGDATSLLEGLGLSDLRVVDTLLRMSSAEGALADNIALANDAWDSNSALTDEAAQRYATTESQLQLAKNSVTNMMTSLGTALLPIVTQAANAIGGIADSFAALDDGTQSVILSVLGVVAAAGPVMTVIGTLTKGIGTIIGLISSPVGMVAAIGLAGAAAVHLFQQTDRAATQSRLDKRFGDITLSAEEMDDAIREMLGEPIENMALMSDAAEDVTQSIAQLKDSANAFDKLMLKAEMGLTVDEASLQAAAAQMVTDTQAVVGAQQLSASLAVDAVFGDAEEGTSLSESFGSYFSGLNGEATAKGKELADAIEKGMADDFLDETETETIEALRSKMQRIITQATSLDSQGAMLRFKMEAKAAELDAASLNGLLERANTAVQAGVDEIAGNREILLTYTYNIAAAEGWDDDKLREQVDAIGAQTDANVNEWLASSYTEVWDAVGSRVTGGFETEINSVAELLPEVIKSAYGKAQTYMNDIGSTDPDDFRTALWTNLQDGFYGMDWSGIVDSDTQKEAQAMYEPLKPMQETLQSLSDEMGDAFPEVLQNALDQLDMLQLMTMDNTTLSTMFAGSLAGDTAEAATAGETVGQAGVEGVGTGVSGMAAEGANAGAGYVNALIAEQGSAYSAGMALTRAAIAGAKAGQDSHSPSKAFGKLGDFAVQGYVGGVHREMGSAYSVGVRLAEAAMQGVIIGQDSHSPSRRFNRLGQYAGQGYEQGATASIAKAATAIETMWDGLDKKQKTAAAARAAAAAAAAATAEADRQQRILDEINAGTADILQTDTAAYNERMALLSDQTAAMMAFAGAHSIWYQDDKGSMQAQEASDRYDDLIAKQKDYYEWKKSELEAQGADQAALDALKQANEERLDLLKKQKDAEVSAIKEQYALQKEMATDWLKTQKEQLQDAFDAKRKAYEEDDYEDELAALKKKQRQSKSAREKRELQEQIDKMERDHALELEEEALQSTLDGYDKLIDAVNAGLIGLGDLTGNTAFGDLSFGTSGLSALDTVTAQQLQAVLGSLSGASLQNITGTATSAQYMAALQSAISPTAADIRVNGAGNTYQIDLRGAVVRDEKDITTIVEQLEARIRAAAR